MAKKSSSDTELVFKFLYGVIKFFLTGIKGIFIMFKGIYNLIKRGFNKTNNTKNNKSSNSIKGVDMTLFDKSLNNESRNMNDYEKDLEERMDNLDLEDWQKELVREGKYDPENFEEDDSVDEDDYYHEDDE